MTPKQQERLKNKIRNIKAALAADKKHWHGYYHDGQGLRYVPPRFYVQLGDFSGGLRYFNWFNKNFPDDYGYPEFLFEWTIILFKTGRRKEAEKKAFQTFTRNIYLFDKFFGRPITPIEMWEGSNLARPVFATDHFSYSCKNDNLLDFAEWLLQLMQTELFIQASTKYIDIQKHLKNERDITIREQLGKKAQQLIDKF
jgi:hypothetical protein